MNEASIVVIIILVFCITLFLGFFKFFWKLYESSLEKKEFFVDVRISESQFYENLILVSGENADDLTYHFNLLYLDRASGTYHLAFNTKVPFSLSERKVSNVVDLSYIKIALNKITKVNFHYITDFQIELLNESEGLFEGFDPKTLYSFLYDYIYKVEFLEDEGLLKITRDAWEEAGIRKLNSAGKGFAWGSRAFGTNLESWRKNAVLGLFIYLLPFIFCTYATFHLDFFDPGVSFSLKVFLVSIDLVFPILILFILYSSIEIPKYKKLLDQIFLNFISRVTLGELGS